MKLEVVYDCDEDEEIDSDGPDYWMSSWITRSLLDAPSEQYLAVLWYCETRKEGVLYVEYRNAIDYSTATIFKALFKWNNLTSRFDRYSIESAYNMPYKGEYKLIINTLGMSEILSKFKSSGKMVEMLEKYAV